MAGVAVVATALLSAKPALNPLVRRLSRQDVVATLKFLILAVVVLPLLPDRAFGPFDALNPRQIGTLVVLMAGISFLGYAAAALAGMADVDAITLSMARLAHGSLPPRVAVLSIFLAAASNTAVKAILAARLGGWAFGRRIASAFAVVLAAGAVTVGLWAR